MCLALGVFPLHMQNYEHPSGKPVCKHVSLVNCCRDKKAVYCEGPCDCFLLSYKKMQIYDIYCEQVDLRARG